MKIRTSATDMPGTNDSVSLHSGIHSPVPSYKPSAEPSPVRRATYSVPLVSSRLFLRRAFSEEPLATFLAETNL